MKRNEILYEIKKRVRKIEPNAEIWLYGSRANNTAKKDSDWDILIVLDKEKISFEYEKQLTSPIYDLEFQIGEVLSVFIYTKTEWEKRKHTPFYNNVLENKIVL